MNVLDVWAHKLAEEVAPQESDLAPLWVQAFAEGGAARRELYASAGATAGGFLPGVATPVLPVVLQALSGVAAAIVPALASKYAADFLGCVKNGLTVMELNQRAKQSPLHNRPSAAGPAPQPAIPSGDTYAPLKRLVEAMGRELRAQGLSEEQCDLVTFRALKALLEEPQGAAQFVQQLSSAR